MVRRKESINFEINDQREVQVAEKLIKGTNGKLIADMGYAATEFVRKDIKHSFWLFFYFRHRCQKLRFYMYVVM